MTSSRPQAQALIAPLREWLKEYQPEREDYLNDGGYLAARNDHANACNALAQLEAILVPSPPAGWQPIETAPKDGTRIVLGWITGLVSCGLWDTFAGHVGWHTGHGVYDGSLAPQFWTPLPDPPSAAVASPSTPVDALLELLAAVEGFLDHIVWTDNTSETDAANLMQRCSEMSVALAASRVEQQKHWDDSLQCLVPDVASPPTPEKDIRLRTASESVGWLNSEGPLTVAPQVESKVSTEYPNKVGHSPLVTARAKGSEHPSTHSAESAGVPSPQEPPDSEAIALLKRLRGWDMLTYERASDGPYWISEIDRVLAASPRRPGAET